MTESQHAAPRPDPSAAARRPSSARRLAAIVAVCAGVVSLVAVDFANRHVDREEDARFAAAAERATDRIREQADIAAQTLSGARGLYAASRSVERNEWSAYCGTLRMRERLACCRSLTFVALVPAGQAADFVAKARQDGAPNYRIDPVPAAGADAYVVHFAEPETLNRAAVGRDVAGNAVVRRTLLAARDSGQATLSPVLAPDALDALGWAGRTAVLALPVFRNGAPSGSVDERRSNCVGWVAAVIDTDALLADRGERSAGGIHLQVFDDADATAVTRIFGGGDPTGAARYTSHDLRTDVRMEICGHVWTARVTALPAFGATASRASVWITGLLGFVISALLTVLAWAMASTRSRAIALAGQMSASLRRSEELHRRILETTLDAVVTVDQEGRVVGWNGRAESLFGWTFEAAVGRTLAETIVPPEARERHLAGFRRALADGNVGAGRLLQAEALTRDGRRIPVEIALCAQHAADDATVTAFLRDASERRRAEAQTAAHLAEVESARDQLRTQAAELAAAKDEADAANRAKSDFLATMSHEIRTPMNGVLGMTSLLLDTRLDAEQRDYAASIRSSADALLTLINDILDFSKIEAGKMTLEPEGFDLRVVVEEAVELMTPRAAEKSLEVALRYQPSAPRRFVSDSGRIRQVVLNLVSNAVKFTAAGHVLVDVECEGRAEGRATMRVRVVDQGIGIPAEKIPLLFQRFTQADSSTTRRFGGTGLGLAVSRRLVELLGGEMGVESEPGKGSTFWFRVPLPIDDAPAPEGLPLPHLSGVRCLVVDDVAVNRRIVMELAAAWGMRPEEAESGAEALECLRSAWFAADPIQVAMLDLHMPDMDGVELARRIKGETSLEPTLLVLLSSALGRAGADDCRAAGFAGVLLKPLRASDLHDALATVWAERGSHVARRLVTRHVLAESRAALRDRSTARSHQPGAVTQVIDCGDRRIRCLLAEDNAVNQKVAVRMLEKLGCLVDVAANGAEAVQMNDRFHYDVLFMDCQMPEMDGFEATRRIRARAASGRRLPIVAMTANALDGDREACLDAGMDDYIPKPVRQGAIKEAIERWCTDRAPCTSHV